MSALPSDEPGFETDVNELPEDANRSEHSLEDAPTDDDAPTALEDAQAEAAEEREEGGYH